MIHIHNGDVVAALASRSGIPGEHVAYRESLVTGPVAPGPRWLENRAQALSTRYSEDLLRTRTSLVEQEQMLADAPSRGEMVLWFEHDLYCLLHLVYLLQRFGDARVSVVWCPVPLSDHDERGLHLLFESRSAVTPSMAKIAREVWSAYTSPDPEALNAWLERDTPEFAFLGEGLRLHASRFPSKRNGLGALEDQTLGLISAGGSEFVSVFDALNASVPRFGFGDSEVWQILQGISWCAVPLLTLQGTPPKALLTITPAGLNVYSGEVDNFAVNDPDTWLGGVHLTRENVWRYDGTRLSRQPAS